MHYSMLCWLTDLKHTPNGTDGINRISIIGFNNLQNYNNWNPTNIELILL